MSTTIEQTKEPVRAVTSSWKYAVISCGTVLLAILIAFWPTYVSIVKIWLRSETFAHGFIILPIVVFLIWRKRHELEKLRPRPAPIALVLVCCCAFLWLLGYASDVAVVQHFAVVAIIPCIIWVTVGTEVVSIIVFPLLYLLFAAPIGDFLTQSLQDVTANLSVWALQVTGIPVYLEGRFINIPSGSFEVAEACSGIRYLIASLALGTLYAYLTYTSYWRRFIFIILSAIVPVIANGIRAYGIIMLANLSNYKLAVGVDHIIYGWLFFGVVVFALFWLGSFFVDEKKNETMTTLNANTQSDYGVGPQQFATWAVLSILISMSSPIFANWLDAQPVLASDRIHFPDGRNGWIGPDPMTAHWNPIFVGATALKASYRKDNKRIDIYLAYYSHQVQGKELVGWQNAVYDDKHAKRTGGGENRIILAGNKSWPVLYTEISSAEDARMIMYWYEIGGYPTANTIIAKLYEMKRRLTAPNKGSAAVVLSVPYEEGKEEAVDTITAFLNDMLQPLRMAVNQ